MSLVGDPIRADDLVQDTIVRTLQKRHAFAPGTNLQAWAFTVMRNLFYSEYRSRRREVEDVDGLHAARLSVLPEQPGSLRFAELRGALAKLPARAAGGGAADRSRWSELRGGRTDLRRTKVGTIKSRVNRARTRLTRLLGCEDGTDLGPDGVTRAARSAASAFSPAPDPAARP